MAELIQSISELRSSIATLADIMADIMADIVAAHEMLHEESRQRAD